MFLRAAARASYRQLLVDQALGRAAVRDFMIADPVAVPADATVRQAVENCFLRYGFAGFPVKQDGTIQGLLSLHDVKECPPEERDRRTVREIMQPAAEPLEIQAMASAADAAPPDEGTGGLLVIYGSR